MIVVRFNSKTYNLFDEITVSTSLDNMVGGFSLSTTLRNENPFDLKDFVEIVIDGVVRVSGYIEKTTGVVNTNESSIIYSGRDILGDLVDDSVPDSVSVNDKAISLQGLCEKTIKALGIQAKVVNKAGVLDTFTDKEIEAIGFGGKAGEFLQSFARKRGVFLITEGDGDLVIFTPPSALSTEKRLTVDSMLSRSFSFDDSQRFNIIRVGSQDNNAASDDADVDNGVDRYQSFKDSEIRGSRYLEISAEQSMNNAELKRRAEEEVNIRRARGFSFTCEVPSHDYVIGELIGVEDDLSGVSGTFLIRAVNYSQNMSGGNTSQLVLCYPESYSAVGKRTSKRKSKMGRKAVLSVDLDRGALLVNDKELQL